MPVNLRPHEIVLDPDTHLSRVMHRCDYVLLVNANDRYFVQGGQVLAQGGDAIPTDRLPGWFWDSFRQLSPEARRSCGLQLPEDLARDSQEHVSRLVSQLDTLSPEMRAQLRELFFEKPSMMSQVESSPLLETLSPSPLPEPLKIDPKPSALTSWVCPECEQEMPLRQKGLHKARHARDRKYANKVSNGNDSR